MAYPPVFDAAEILLDAMMEQDFAHWGPLYVRWEAGLLEALGFGLDLSQCAATGETSDLIYVSPRTGRAVSREARRGLCRAPAGVAGISAGTEDVPDLAATRAGLALTGHFLAERVLTPRPRHAAAQQIAAGCIWPANQNKSARMGAPVKPDDIRSEKLAKALAERYLAYALSTITQRALPDVRDGLKPVHRRLMHAMRLLGLNPAAGFKKCARVVGDVIGKYHPHGDLAIYEALVRLAQDFALRYPLIEGQGNFGNVDGDNAAAMRYTESRLTEVAQALLEGLDEDAVDFRATYDGEDEEPVVLPAAFPNLLANGSSGIAVGMATSIPPHNLGELCGALVALIENPNIQDRSLLKFVKGPDFPTGGIVVEDQAAIAEAYKTGRGGFRLRARWEKEEGARGVYQIVVTEIPYQVQKAKLIERIAELLEQKKLPLLDDIHDESAEDIRIVLTPKNRTVEPAC